jgi:hypothetical protein
MEGKVMAIGEGKFGKDLIELDIEHKIEGIRETQTANVLLVGSSAVIEFPFKSEENARKFVAFLKDLNKLSVKSTQDVMDCYETSPYNTHIDSCGRKLTGRAGVKGKMFLLMIPLNAEIESFKFIQDIPRDRTILSKIIITDRS